ncbi:hypothetical protein ACIRN4_16340 [Pimelobacter simplex]|uniref:hypothetical protein n=1 Tax=Nocardioides simplex TaxID=2045 RepID=UPI003806189B
MTREPIDGAHDTLRLRFVGQEEDGSPINELLASHVAEVLQGVVELTSDFGKAGAFDADGPIAPTVLMRPAQEGSFIIEVLRWAQENPDTAALAGSIVGGPTLGQLISWATKSMRAEVSGFEYLENGNVKVEWQDDTVQEIPKAVWDELQKRKRRRKKQLRQILAPLSDERVTSVDVTAETGNESTTVSVTEFVLTKPDYDAMRPEDDVEESTRTFEVEAQMSAIDFDDPTRWRVKTVESNRAATVLDKKFLGRIANSLAIRKSDIFRLRVREDSIKKNGRTTTTWTVLEVLRHRRGAHDDD